MNKTITTTDKEGKNFTINISTDRNYFSITADGYNRCGCLHDEILELRPDLKPLVDIHLSNLDGVPMHPDANGWWWLAKAVGITRKCEPEQDVETCKKNFLSHIRVTDDLLISCTKAVYDNTDESNARAYWSTIMETMKPYWKQEAQAALELIEKI